MLQYLANGSHQLLVVTESGEGMQKNVRAP